MICLKMRWLWLCNLLTVENKKVSGLRRILESHRLRMKQILRLDVSIEMI